MKNQQIVYLCDYVGQENCLNFWMLLMTGLKEVSKEFGWRIVIFEQALM